MSMKTRLKNDLTFGPRVSKANGFDLETAEYGVERRTNGNVVITLGMTPPFEVPAETAVKLAMLLLKHAGADVKLENGPYAS
jgi:hypothetical protein